MNKTIRVAVTTIGALALSSVSAIAAAQTSEEWHKKSDTAKGVDQIKAPSKGEVYANPHRKKALQDAMNDDGTSKPASTPTSGDKTKSRSSTR
jgi:hypothetical protein